MKTRFVTMVFVALAIFITGRPLGAQELALVRASAAAAIQNNDLDSARQEAIVQVRQRTLREVLRPMVGPEEFQKQLPRLQTAFLQRPEPYLAAFQIENEEIIDDGQRYQVSARADVRRKAVAAALVEQQIVDPLSVAPKPTVMVLVRERFETRVSGTRATELALLKALEKQGFKVVDPEQKKLIDLRNRLFAEGTGDMQAALQSTLAFQADYLIFGEAAVGSSGPLAGTDLKSRHASVTLKLVKASSGKIVSTESAEGSRKHVDELTGGNWALEDAAKAAAEKLLVRFQAILKDEVINGAEIAVDVHGVDYESQAEEAETMLQKTSGVRRVTREMFLPGLAKFDVKYTGATGDLAQSLRAAEIDGQGVEILETLPRYLRVKRAGGQAKANTDTPEMIRRYLEEKYKQLDMEKAREQDKELMAKINELAANKKLSDEQLDATRKEIETKREEVQASLAELEKREQQLKKVEAQKREAERRARAAEQQAAGTQDQPSTGQKQQAASPQGKTSTSAQKQQTASSQPPPKQTVQQEVRQTAQQNYVAAQNYSNANYQLPDERHGLCERRPTGGADVASNRRVPRRPLVLSVSTPSVCAVALGKVPARGPFAA